VNRIGGATASAAVGVVGKFNSFAILPAMAMSSSVSAFAAQNIGAGLFDRAKKSLSVGIAIAMGISLAVFAAVQLFPGPIIGLFSPYEEVIRYGVEYMRTFSLDYLFVPIQFCLNGLIMGAGHTLFTLLNGSLSSLLLRIPVAVLFGSVLGWGLTGIGLAGPAATVFGVLLTGWFVLSGRWKNNRTGIRREDN
jgi:Na+-driven multidrug efflux pump